MKMLVTLLVFVVCVSLAVPVYSQVTGANLSGTITDASGAVIPGAQISIRNTATGIARDIQSDTSGYYTVPNLSPGPYEVKVTAAGFTTAVQSNLTLAVGAQQTLNISMKVGEMSQMVQVTGAAPQIELTSSTLSGQVESKTVLDLPLNGRDWTSLATLHPGVNQIENQMDYSTSARGNRGFGAQLTISGQRSTFNNYRLDGISVNDYANSGPGNVIGAALGVDAIQEFSVLTGGFSAEYGKASGGVVNAISKSGTNGFHGDVYEFLRNSAMDSRDYFSRSADTPLAIFRRNQFGVAAGGPIIKDRTFIFGDYEGFRQAKGITTSIAVPSDAARAGNLVAGAVTVDPAAAAMLAMWPHATPGTSSGDKGQFIFSGLQIVPENFYTVHVDHKLSANDSLFGTYLFDDTDFKQPDPFNDVTLNSHTRRETAVLEESHTFGANFVNAARFGYSRSHAINLFPAGAINPAAGNLALGSTTGELASTIAISGYQRMTGGVGSASHFAHTLNNYEFADDAFWTHGAHTVKFGVDVERMQYNYIALQSPGGRWNFSNIRDYLTNWPKHFEAGIPSTITPRQFRQTLVAGYVQDDWRLRRNLTVNLGLRYEMTTVLSDAKGYLTNLTNLADAMPRCEAQFTSSFTVNSVHIPGTVCGSVGPLYHNPTLHNFEPRVGFAWDPFHDGKTSIRGGFGIYDVLPLPGYFLTVENQSAPFMIFSNVDAPKKSLVFPRDPLNPNPLAGTFFAGGQNVLTNPPAGATPGKLSTSYIESNPHRNYVLEWNLNVQRQLTPNLTVTLGYVGSHGVHMLIRGDDTNMVFPDQTSIGLLVPLDGSKVNSNLGVIRYLLWDSDSFYHAMNLSVDKRMSHGLQFVFSYTWSKSIDDNSSTIAGDTFDNSLNSLYWFDPKSLRGRSDFDLTHSASVNVLWSVPTPKSLTGFAQSAIGGWQMGGIFKINSGVPTTVILNGDPMGLGNGGADQFGIPDLLPGCNPMTPVQYGSSPTNINVSCYRPATVPATSSFASQCADLPDAASLAGTGRIYCANLLGNAGRNTVHGPKLVNLDFSVIKNTPIHRISEAFNVQFRAEIFNILNHSNFAPAVPIDGAGIFDEGGAPLTNGFMNKLATNPRDVQFALKVIW